MKPRVKNKYKDKIEPDDVWAMRPSELGNPYKIGRDGDRATVIAKHKQDTLANKELCHRLKKDFRGRNFVCCCAPLPCHCDIYLKIANEPFKLKLGNKNGWNQIK